MTVVDPPARRTRPSNRRALILAAAAELMATRGYEHVNVGDIAAAVEVGPSALYRHFPGKDAILVRAVTDLADQCCVALDAVSDTGADTGVEQERVLATLATFALDHRHAGVLWRRELRHLPAADHAVILAATRGPRQRITAAVRLARPELRPEAAEPLASGVLAVVLSPSFHRVELARPAYDGLVTELAERVVDVDLPPSCERTSPASPTGLARAARREQLLEAAVRLFAERTYASVGMDDVAASVGMATSSLYNHFPSKHHLLSSALHRANGYLQLALAETLAGAQNPTAALRDLVAGYARFALGHPHLVEVLITEVRNLRPEDATELLQSQRAYVDDWVHLLRQVHPDLDGPATRVVVHAALMVVNDLARLPGLRCRTDAQALVTALGRRVLDV